MRKIVVAVTGASGSIYAKVLLDKLSKINEMKVGVVMSENAKDVWKHELQNEDYNDYKFDFYNRNDFMAPFASGSAGYDAMIVCPCSMGTLGRIAVGMSGELISRSADVMLKERRKLILIVRESPLSLIHISNMKTVTEAGGIICPASPSFYSVPKTIEEVAATVVNRALQLANIETNMFRWNDQ